MKFNKVKQSSIVLMIVIIVAKLVGMLRDIVLANYFGTSNISDAYLIASSVPTLLFYFIGHSISTAYIPMYNKAKYERSEKSSLTYTNSIINISFIIATFLVFFLFAWPESVVKLFASGFDVETKLITAKIIRISAVSLYLMVFVSVLGGYLQANKNFVIPAMVSLPKNVAIVVSIAIAAMYGIEWLGWGLILSCAMELLLLLPFALTKGYRYSFALNIKDSYVKDTWYVVLPIIVGMCVGQINKIIDRSLASVVCEGGVSALTYASVINNAVQEVLVTGIITILFSNCAEWVVKGEHEKIREKLSSTVKTMILFLLPAMVGVIILAEPIVSLLLGRGEFDRTSVNMTVGALRFYTMGLLFLAIRDALVKVFYAYKKTKTTTIVSVVSILINIIFNLVLYRLIGLNGLALATAISAIFNSLVLYVLLRRLIGDFGLKSTIVVAVKSLIACGIMAFFVLAVKHFMGNVSTIFSLGISVCVGVAVYFCATIVLKVDAVMDIAKKAKGLLKR